MKVYVVLCECNAWPEDGGGLVGIEAIFESAEGAAGFIRAKEAADKEDEDYEEDLYTYYVEIWTVAP